MFPAARIDLSAIPKEQRDVVAALLREHGVLVGENTALKDETASLKQIVRRLEHLVAELNHVVHGKKSEKLSEDERQLAFEDLEAAVAEVEEQHDRRASPDDASRRKLSQARRNRGNLPADLPRIERIVEPGSLTCPCGCGQMHRIGEGEPSRRHAFETDGEHRAPRHRARAAPRDRDGPPQIRLPRLYRWGDAGARAGGADRERAAHRGCYRACAGQQVRRPPPIASPEPDPRPVGCRHPSQHARRLGRRRRVPSGAGRRPAGRAPEGVHQAVHGR